MVNTDLRVNCCVGLQRYVQCANHGRSAKPLVEYYYPYLTAICERFSGSTSIQENAVLENPNQDSRGVKTTTDENAERLLVG